MNVTPSGKVDVGDISVSAGSPTGAEQLKPNEKQIEVFTVKFIYDCFGYLCMLFMYTVYVTLFKCVIKFDKVFLE